MEIYLDANATTPVLPAAQAAALACMGERFGNPSSTHATGLRARALLDDTRARARRVLGAPTGQLLFTSGATEGIQTAVLSALISLRGRDDVDCLLYGATEHKAVPAALHHWNRVLDLGLVVAPIPVDPQGRHELDWLRRHAGRAGLVCTMAANNESGVISDLDGIEAALAGSPALWLVDGVQGLGKLDLRLAERRIDYAPFSGHKLYAPKGIGLLYVRDGAPFTPLMAGGGQEGGLRSGTENMAGVAALGAVLAALEDGHTFASPALLAQHRARLTEALSEAFPGLVFNAPPALSLPTTLNFSVPGVASRLLLELFDAAGMRVSGGSACSAAQAAPSFVLEAMGLPAWQTGSAIRLSFGPLADEAFIDAACARIRACGEALRAHGLHGNGHPPARRQDGITRFSAEGTCCYLLSDAASQRAVLIDPLPALAERLARQLRSQGLRLAAVLHTRPRPEPVAGAAAQALRAALPPALRPHEEVDVQGWPLGEDAIALGPRQLLRLPECRGYVLRDALGRLPFAFVGEAWSTDADEAGVDAALAAWLTPETLCLPHRDPAGHMAHPTRPPAAAPVQGLVQHAADLPALAQQHPGLTLVDVREAHEQGWDDERLASLGLPRQALPLSQLLNVLPEGAVSRAEGELIHQPLLFICRSGQRSTQAARLLRRLGHGRVWSLAGGVALLEGRQGHPTLTGALCDAPGESAARSGQPTHAFIDFYPDSNKLSGH